MEQYNIIEKDTESEIIEKKSKFICNIYYVENINQINEQIKQIKSKYYDAKHWCFAYKVIEKKEILTRYSDDGEPSGTAGAPILSIIENKKLYNILVIVTRYFGGVLLGTGGLVKAYSKVTLNALDKTDIVTKQICIKVSVILNYSDLEKFKYICKLKFAEILEEKYEENVKFLINIPKKNEEDFLNEIKNKLKFINYDKSS